MPPAWKHRQQTYHNKNRKETLCAGSTDMRLGGESQGRRKVLERSLPVQRHVWSDGVVEVLEFGEGGRSLGDGEFAGVEGPEFGPGGVVGALDAAVGLWGSWREDEEWKLEVATCGFELGHELGAAVDLDGLDPGVLGEQRFEESAGVAGGGAGEDEAEHELGGRADGAELLGGLSVAGDGHVVDLDELAGRGGAHAGGEARGVAAGEVAAPLRRGPSAEEGAGLYVPESQSLLEDPADGGLGQPGAVAGEHDAQPRLAHEGVFPALVPDSPLLGARPFAPAGRARPAALRGQPGESAFPPAPLPAVQGRPGPADGLEGGGLRAALGAEPVVHLDPAEPVERVRGRGLVDLDGAVGEVSLGIELHGSVILLIVENQGYPNRRPDAAHARHRGVPARPAIRPREGPFAWADRRLIPERDRSVLPRLPESHMCLN